MSSVTGLLGDEELERSSVVANCLMNRERRLPGYNRELGLDLAGHLRARTAEGARVRWLDLCCGTAGALFEAAHTLPRRSRSSAWTWSTSSRARRTRPGCVWSRPRSPPGSLTASST
ncbi:hypothetical protein [Nonomuraea recticatena]|uniref:hypothetical protein n=1 Tax=Nonomuraea recticatena TaxID=46178 RepID=UPI00360F3D27